MVERITPIVRDRYERGRVMKFTIKPCRYSATSEGKRQWAGYSIWFEDSLVLGNASPTLPNAYSYERGILMGLLDGLVRFDRRVRTHPLDIVAISVPEPIRITIGLQSPLGEEGTHALSISCLTLLDRIVGTGARVTFYTPEPGEK